MLQHLHCLPDERLAPQQVARMLWMCLITQGAQTAQAEGEQLKDNSQQPRRNGNADSETVEQHLAHLISDPRAAAEVDSMTVDLATRSVHFANYDTPPQQFNIPYHSAQLQPSGSVAVGGNILCRLALEFSRSRCPQQQEKR